MPKNSKTVRKNPKKYPQKYHPPLRKNHAKKIPPSQKSRILKMKTKKCLKERKEHQNELRY